MPLGLLLGEPVALGEELLLRVREGVTVAEAHTLELGDADSAPDAVAVPLHAALVDADVDARPPVDVTLALDSALEVYVTDASGDNDAAAQEVGVGDEDEHVEAALLDDARGVAEASALSEQTPLGDDVTVADTRADALKDDERLLEGLGEALEPGVLERVEAGERVEAPEGDVSRLGDELGETKGDAVCDLASDPEPVPLEELEKNVVAVATLLPLAADAEKRGDDEVPNDVETAGVGVG